MTTAPTPTPAVDLLEPLQALDLILWLGSEAAAARALDVHQSTVNRCCSRLWRALGLPSPGVLRRSSLGSLANQPPQLASLRRIHQQLRFHDLQGLRLQWDPPLPEGLAAELRQLGWLPENSRRWQARQVPDLLRARVIDAWRPAHGNRLLTLGFGDRAAPLHHCPTGRLDPSSLFTSPFPFSRGPLHPANRPGAGLH